MNDNLLLQPDEEVIRIFISYSQESPEHEDRVLVLANRLRRDGFDCSVDQYIDNPEEGWQRWMRNQIQPSRFVLVICTETYRRRYYGHEELGVGRGANREGLVIDLEIYNNNGRNEKFIPIVFTEAARNFIPDTLQPYSNYIIGDETGYQALYRRLRGIPPHERPALGMLRPLTPLARQRDFTSDQRRPKTVQEYAGDAIRWLEVYMQTLPNISARVQEAPQRFNEEAWREQILGLAQVWEGTNTELLAYEGVPGKAIELHYFLQEIALHMDRTSTLLRYALYERRISLIGESSQEMDIVQRLLNENMLPKLQELQRIGPIEVAVDCNVHPFEGMVVYFRFDNLAQQANDMVALAAQMGNRDPDPNALQDMMAIFARVVFYFHNWQVKDSRGIPVPPPNHEQASTYLPLWRQDQAHALLEWIIAEGLPAAMRLAR